MFIRVDWLRGCAVRENVQEQNPASRSTTAASPKPPASQALSMIVTPPSTAPGVRASDS